MKNGHMMKKETIKVLLTKSVARELKPEQSQGMAEWAAGKLPADKKAMMIDFVGLKFVVSRPADGEIVVGISKPGEITNDQLVKYFDAEPVDDGQHRYPK